jgi:hypothetical protein
MNSTFKSIYRNMVGNGNNVLYAMVSGLLCFRAKLGDTETWVGSIYSDTVLAKYWIGAKYERTSDSNSA